MKDQIYSVSQVNLYIKNMFVRETLLSRIYVKGEVSNCKYHSSGHIYFTLKDSKGQMTCVMFAGQRSGLSFRMSEGQSVIVLGTISVYERDGKYQLYANEIIADGAGALYEQFEQRKAKLEAEGLFDEVYKKPVKRYNKTIGVVTAVTGAAIQDIINISSRRNPYVQLILYPARVQGEGAKETIVEGIEYLDRLGLDVIIVGRGGGSIEDLWAFNEEEVAWAVFNCRTPVISAVGHETDTTIVDYVADLRAPTPSAAAELAVMNITEMQNYLDAAKETMRRQMEYKCNHFRGVLEKHALLLKYAQPSYKIRQTRQLLQESEDRMKLILENKLRGKRHLLELYMEKMKGLSPIDRLKKGFSYVSMENEKVLRSVKEVHVGDRLKITLKDGELDAVVDKVKKVRRL